MADKAIAIIGGGLAGLAAGVYASATAIARGFSNTAASRGAWPRGGGGAATTSTAASIS